jgi:hypothetical protein
MPIPFLPIIAAVLPYLAGPLANRIATEVAGPEVGATAQRVAEVAVAVAGSDDPSAVVAAMQDPTKLSEFRAGILSHELDVIRAENDDRANARAMHTAARDWVTPTLAFTVTGLFGSAVFFVMAFGLPTEGRDYVAATLGSLGSAWLAVISFYFGTSMGARISSHQIASIAGRGKTPEN